MTVKHEVRVHNQVCVPLRPVCLTGGGERYFMCVLFNCNLNTLVLHLQACKIVGGQRYTKRLNEKQITALLKVTCQRPRDRENDILQVILESL